MSEQVIKFLAESGGGSLSEMMVRVSTPPHLLAEKLERLDQRGYLRTSTPDVLYRFQRIVENERQANGYDGYNNSKQRSTVIAKLMKEHTDLAKSRISLSIKGFAFGIS